MKKIILLILLALSANVSAFAQGQFTTQGNDFWLAFGMNNSNPTTSIDFQIRVVAVEATTVTLTFTNNATLNTTVNVAAGQVYTRTLSDAEKTALYNNATAKTSKSLHVTSNHDIALFALNLKSATTDATNVLPITNLGTDYYQLSYHSPFSVGDGYTVIATADGTTVSDNGTLVATLNRGEVYSTYFGINSDGTGHHITSSSPIAYFVTNACVQIPTGITYCDCLFQQMVPVPSWGNTFLVPVTNRGRDRIRIIASQNGTIVTQVGGTVQAGLGAASLTLNQGQWVELEITQANNGCYISSNKPVAVTAYLMGTGNFTGVNATGDPALAWVPPIEQTVAHVAMSPFFVIGSALTTHYAMIVTPTATRNVTMVSVGGGALQALFGGTWTTNTPSGYSYYSMPLTSTTDTYVFENSNGVTILGYGLGAAESYYYLAAASARQLDPAFYINEIHFQDAIGQSYCDDDFVFRASIQYPLSPNAGKLRWYIDDVERTSVQDLLTWTMPKGDLLGPPQPHTIRLHITDLYNNTKDVITSFSVLPIPEVILAANLTAASICSGTAPTVTVANTQTGLTYHVFDALTGGTQVGSAAGNGGTINIPCTGNLSASTIYYVEASNGVCPSSPRTPVTINVVIRPTVPILSAAAICDGSSPVIHLASSVSGVDYNVYTANPGDILVGTGSGTGSAIDITLSTTPSSTTIYWVEAALGSCISTSRSSVSVTVNPKPALTSSNIAVINTSCNVGTGSITVSASGVDSYSKDNGSTWQSTGSFTGLTAGTYQIRVRTAAGCVSDAVSATVNQLSTLDATSAVTNVLCNGESTGTITITATGGTPAYQYKLGSDAYQNGNSFSSVAAGTYSVTVKDVNNCEKTISGIVVTQPATALSATPTVTDLTCNGGTPNGKITIAASGGTPPYQYSINSGGTYQSNNEFTDLSIGAYGVVVKDDNGCTTVSQTTHVLQPLAITVPTPTKTNVTCNGGSDGTITVSGVSGGTSPYQYSFDDGTYSSTTSKTGLSAGNHTVRVKDDHGCISSEINVTITEPAVILTSADVGAAAICPDSPAIITINNTVPGVVYKIFDAATDGMLITSVTGNGATMNVNIGIIPVTKTFYIETLSGTCVSVSRVSVTVTVNPLATAINITGPDNTAICLGESPSLTATSSGVTNPVYKWYASDGTTPLQTGATYSTGALTTTTTYYVSVSGTGLCENAVDTRRAVTVTVNPTPDIADKTVDAICSGSSFSFTPEDVTNGVVPAGTTYSWSAPSVSGITGTASGTNANSISGTLTNTSNAAINVEYYVTPKSGDCSGSAFTVTVTVYGALSGGTIGSNQIKCYNTVPDKFTDVISPSGGIDLTYQWQYDNNGIWTDIASATGLEYTSGALTQTTKFRRKVTCSLCGTDYSNEITITVHPQSLYDYPDIRAYVCSDILPVNLGKYLDTTALISFSFEKVSGANISSDGTISSGLQNMNIHTYKYTVTNPCVSNIVRKFYLQTIDNKTVRPLRDTIVVCYDKAEALQLNQILGIDAEGSWEYDASLNDYVTVALLPPYTGALIFNGKTAYEDSGVTGSKNVVFKYKSDPDSCLTGKEYTIVIVLTPNILL